MPLLLADPRSAITQAFGGVVIGGARAHSRMTVWMKRSALPLIRGLVAHDGHGRLQHPDLMQLEPSEDAANGGPAQASGLDYANARTALAAQPLHSRHTAKTTWLVGANPAAISPNFLHLKARGFNYPRRGR